MNKPADAVHASAIEIRFGQVGLIQAKLHSTDPGAVLDELTGRVSSAPRFFDRTAICLDLSALDRAPEIEEMRAIIDVIRRAGLIPVGFTQGPSGLDELSRALEMPVLTHFRSQGKPVPVIQPAPAPAPPASTSEPAAAALIHHQPVRSGQRIYARNRDLIVTSTVGAGAEVMADGCVHVYGSLRGRVMAGARGEVTARVFVQDFHAELVSIAGVFRVFETIPPELIGKPTQAWLAGEDLNFARIGG